MSETCTSFGVGSGISPSVSRGVGTFPGPTGSIGDAQAAKSWSAHAGEWCQERSSGLTELFNRIHQNDPSTAALQQLIAQVDGAVALAYDWADIDLHHGFWDTPQGPRFTIGPAARVELMDRLLELNYSRYAEEVDLGLHETGRTRRRDAASAKGAQQLWADDGTDND